MHNPNQAPNGAELERAGLGSNRGAPALKEVPAQPGPRAVLPDDLSRDVYCVLGMPIDAVDMPTVLHRVGAAAQSDAPFLVSTANLNFLTSSLRSEEFRDSLHLSDLCTADGTPVVWLARLLGVPLKERVAGSDMFDRLADASAAQRLTTYFFGGARGAAEAACGMLRSRSGLEGVGSTYPGYGTIEELSGDRFIDAINASKAHFLVVALGAAKGQAWLVRNHHRLEVPVRAHLGATVNFQAGSVKRAPAFLRRTGLEWLWRIKEEPHLWRRYWADGCDLFRLLLTRALPLAVELRRHRSTARKDHAFRVRTLLSEQSVTLRLSGHGTEANIARAIVYFRNAVNLGKARMVVDLGQLDFVDARFLGLLLMVRKQLSARGARLQLIGASRRVTRLFRLNELGYLISAEPKT
jgi:N-acetylglucosaminyldiphosphoundecaprenol N-acetyl-beta-D-mannosaminyltransferase